ncbi:MAG: Ig domain-containing protein [Candidatus Limnocylindrales bacterium]
MSGDVAAGLSATLQYSLPGSGTYSFRLGGVGYGDPLSNGYSDYASAGEYTLDLLVSDALTAPPTITTSSLPNALYGQSYSATLSGAGGVPSYVYGITSTSGPLPGSLTLASNTGNISGIPVDGAGTYTMTFKIVDAQGNSSTSSSA